ncbi:MAG: UDP-N-acetylglucosamine 1-carboxyvinyltransferase [Clostridiales bacterium]|nr:UDP-N-acetylglucosamine 1-carboxyvinyltransferase [Clostridiales bacterium]
MERLVIRGGKRLSGKMNVHGAKNSALPILAAALMTDDVCVIHNCPQLTDIEAAIKILEYLGCKVSRQADTVIVDSKGVNRYDIPDSLMREMRSSVVFLGSILSRMGRAQLSFPGGCEIGLRPIDLHISSIKRFGVEVKEEYGRLFFEVKGKLKATEIVLSFPSVGATENIMLTACCADGVTTVVNAAREPEISDLADFLNSCGAKIYGAGEGNLTIEGVKKLHSAEHTVIPDRIVATTYMCCAAVTNGSILIDNIVPSHLGLVLPTLEEMGCFISIDEKSNALMITAPPKLRRIKNIVTMPHPGFPTDAQAPLMAVASVAQGTSVFVENIFESRYKHASELARLGAKIKVEGKVAIVEGVECLSGASVMATDLRGGASLVIAGLCAKGKTEISNVYHIDRGYEELERQLRLVGADIKRKE